jgi:hypothetical protein
MKSHFEKILLANLHLLWKIIDRSKIKQKAYIQDKYSEYGLSFNETLSFLIATNVVKQNKDELKPSRHFRVESDSLDDFRRSFLRFLFSANASVSNELAKFLLNFHNHDSEISFRPTPLEKIAFSDARNLLFELEFIILSTDGRDYLVNPTHWSLFSISSTSKVLSYKAFKKAQLQREQIGLKAELAVINYEIVRLTGLLTKESEIEHTSLRNVMAGYDIRSFEGTLDSKNERVERLIEVKAVSINDYNFYWSRNEIEVARKLGEKYYLYLLPVISADLFDFENLLIIGNAIKNVYANEFDWTREVESISFSRAVVHTK